MGLPSPVRGDLGIRDKHLLLHPGDNGEMPSILYIELTWGMGALTPGSRDVSVVVGPGGGEAVGGSQDAWVFWEAGEGLPQPHSNLISS